MVEGGICPCRDLDTRQHLCLPSAVGGGAGVPPQDRADGWHGGGEKGLDPERSLVELQEALRGRSGLEHHPR